MKRDWSVSLSLWRHRRLLREFSLPAIYAHIAISSTVGVWSNVISVCMSVCLFVCLSARISQKPRVQILPNYLYVTCDRGSVLLWRQCDTLCIYGFVDDVMFSHNRPKWQNQRRRVYVSGYIYLRKETLRFPLDAASVTRCRPNGT